MDITTAGSNALKGAATIFSGLLLITFTLLPVLLIIGYWPDRIPFPKEQLKPLYIDELFDVRLACIPDSICCVDSFKMFNIVPDTVAANRTAQDTTTTASANANGIDTASIPRGVPTPPLTTTPSYKTYSVKTLIDLNTLILILVAAAGFLGNMIHIATSFTTFVGSGSFKRDWLLWYFVKPFTASALAVGLYFVFRGGFLNYTADAASINLYGILTIAVLTGLFTDRATLKLAEVFDVIFSIKKDVKSSDSRPDKLDRSKLKILKVDPQNIKAEGENVLTITGENLTTKKLFADLGAVAIPISNVTGTTGTIKFILTEAQKQLEKLTLRILTEDQDEVLKQDLMVIKKFNNGGTIE
jgi:hypothetical protein